MDKNHGSDGSTTCNCGCGLKCILWVPNAQSYHQIPPKIKTNVISSLIPVDKHKKKMRNEEAASGVDCEESELDNILQNLKEETEETAETYNKQTCGKNQQEQAEKTSAEEVRKQAMESLSETKKRKSLGMEEGTKPKRNTGSDTMVYLKQCAEQENDIRQQELELKKCELDLHRQQQEHNFQQQTVIVQQ